MLREKLKTRQANIGVIGLGYVRYVLRWNLQGNGLKTKIFVVYSVTAG